MKAFKHVIRNQKLPELEATTSEVLLDQQASVRNTKGLDGAGPTGTICPPSLRATESAISTTTSGGDAGCDGSLRGRTVLPHQSTSSAGDLADATEKGDSERSHRRANSSHPIPRQSDRSGVPVACLDKLGIEGGQDPLAMLSRIIDP